MGVLVSFSVLQLLHEPGGGVADHQRHRFGQLPDRIGLGVFVGFVKRVRFRRQRQIDHRLGQMDRAFGHSEKVAGLVGGNGLFQRPRVGQPHVLAGKPDHAAGHIQWVLAGFQHPGQPVHGGVRVRIAHGFVQRRDQVVVFLPLLVIEQGLFGGALFHRFLGYGNAAVLRHISVEYDHLQGGQGRAGVPVGEHCQRLQQLFRDVDGLAAKAPRVLQGTAQKSGHLIRFEGLQNKDLAAGEQRPVDLEGRVFGGSADQDDAALLHKGKEGVLLRLVEPVDLVHKHDGTLTETAVFLRLLHHGPDLLDAAGHGRKINEGSLGFVCDDPRQGGFADPGRAPEDHGGDLIRLDQSAQHLAGAQQMGLPHILVQGGGPQAGGQRLRDLALKQCGLFHGSPPSPRVNLKRYRCGNFVNGGVRCPRRCRRRLFGFLSAILLSLYRRKPGNQVPAPFDFCPAVRYNRETASRCGGTGRRKGLKIPRWQQRTGSIPVGGTESKRNARTLVSAFLFAFYVCQVVCQKCLKWQTKRSKYPSF